MNEEEVDLQLIWLRKVATGKEEKSLTQGGWKGSGSIVFQV